MSRVGTKRVGGHGEVGTCPRATDPSREATKGPPAQIPSRAKRSPRTGAQREHWGRFWVSQGAAGHRHRCLSRWETRTKCRLQKNMCVATIRRRPQGDPQKEDVNQKNGPTSHKVEFEVSVTLRWWVGGAPVPRGCGGSDPQTRRLLL